MRSYFTKLLFASLIIATASPAFADRDHRRERRDDRRDHRDDRRQERREDRRDTSAQPLLPTFNALRRLVRKAIQLPA